ncbi:MAG: ABC transporter ATP-binding protein [Stellaceae bacterium]
MSATGLALENVSLRLGEFALSDVSFAAARGEILVLLGANGAGKSVCLETIAGFHRPAQGRVLISGADVTGLSPERRRVAFLVQDFGLFPHLSIAENVAIGAEVRLSGSALDALIARFGIAHLAATRPEHLSPGEKQRAALARALASRPAAYLFDEPFAALDAPTAESLGQDLATFVRGTGAPSVFVTHDRAEAMALADRVAVIEDGFIRQHGPADQVFARPASIDIARLIGVENLIEGELSGEFGDGICIRVGSARLTAVRHGTRCSLQRRVILSIRAEHVHLMPADALTRENRLCATVVALRRVGPLWRVTLDCGFPLIAYALPQTARAAALGPGARLGVEIEPDAIHLLPAAP